MYKTILIPVDLGEAGSWTRALPVAVALCRAFGGRLHVMTVVPDFGMPIVGSFFPDGFEAQVMTDAEGQLETFVRDNVPKNIDVAAITAHGTIYDQILATARNIDADLIVMGAHRPDLKEYLLGPNAARVVRHYARSVLVVRA